MSDKAVENVTKHPSLWEGLGGPFLSFVIKEAKHILRDKRTMLILFGMPVVMMLLFGFAITTDVKNVRTVVVTSQMDHQTPGRAAHPQPAGRHGRGVRQRLRQP